MKHEVKKPTISIIVAMDKNRAIGKNNSLLWRIPEDLKHFKDITMSHPVIMGRKTYESIGRSLHGRDNIVISRNPDLHIEGVIVSGSLEEAINKAGELDQEEIFIIGGGSIYAQALPRADKLYITYINDIHEADVYFPMYEEQFKKVKESSEYRSGDYRFKFLEFIKG